MVANMTVKILTNARFCWISVLKVESMKPSATENANINENTAKIVSAPIGLVCYRNARVVRTASAGRAFVSAAIAIPSV